MRERICRYICESACICSIGAVLMGTESIWVGVSLCTAGCICVCRCLPVCGFNCVRVGLTDVHTYCGVYRYVPMSIIVNLCGYTYLHWFKRMNARVCLSACLTVEMFNTMSLRSKSRRLNAFYHTYLMSLLCTMSRIRCYRIVTRDQKRSVL